MKRKPINGRKYTLYIDYDRQTLVKHQGDWIEWFKQRVLFILIDPIEEILKPENKKKFDNENFTIFLGITTLICCGIEAMGGFYKGYATSKNFKIFVKSYMDAAYRKDEKKLEALHNHFRCGLAHGFCIKQGGIKWRGTYFSEHKTLGLLINILKLFKDFKHGFLRYINDVEKARAHSVIKKDFLKRFEHVFILGN